MSKKGGPVGGKALPPTSRGAPARGGPGDADSVTARGREARPLPFIMCGEWGICDLCNVIAAEDQNISRV